MQNSKSPVGTTDEQSTKDEAMHVKPNLNKTNVVRRFFGSQKMWVCVCPKGRVDHWSIRYRKKDAISEFVKSYNPDKYQWEYFKKQGWQCVKVKIDYEQINVKQ